MIVERYLFEDFIKTESAKPDIVKVDLSSGLIQVEPEFVISRNYNGSMLSKYKDDIWDLSSYSESSNKRLNFTNIKMEEHRKEIKRLIFIIIVFSNGKNGTTKAPSTLYGYLNDFFIPLSEYAMKNNISITELFERQSHMDSYVNHEKVNLTMFMATLKLLKKLGNKNTGIEYIHNKEFHMKITSLIAAQMKNYKQTAPIPVSIFISAANQRWEHVERIGENLPALIEFMNDCLENKHYARKKSNEYGGNRWKKYDGYIEWSEAVEAHGLFGLFSYYGINNRNYLYGFLSHFQGTCRHLICTYTGMRYDEIKVLRIECFNDRKNDAPPRISGIEKKINGVPTKLTWVTVPEIKRIIEILKQINYVIMKYCAPTLKDVPLFLKMSFFTRNELGEIKVFKDAMAMGKDPSAELPLAADSIIITKKHIKEELGAIEPNRRREEEEKYMVGKTWHFTYHQYRRSLAVYALGSGLVSVKALQRQFGHLLHTMTQYYGNGSFAAKSLTGINHSVHLNSYMKHIKGEIDFLSYFKNVLFNIGTLYGAFGRFKEKHESQIEDCILEDRRETIKKFKNGSMYYRETAVGGCVSIEPCDSLLFRSYTACFGCEKGYQIESKVRDAIEEQKNFLDKLDPNSIEYRTEKVELYELEKNYEIIRRKK